MPIITSLQGYWKFDEASGNAADASGNGNTLTNVNTVTYSNSPAKLNNAAHLAKASSQFFSLADASQTGLDIVGDLTFNGWIYLATSISGSGNDYNIINKYSSSGQKSYMFRLMENDTLRFQCTFDGSTDTFGGVSWVTSISTWYMVTCVYNAAAGSVAFYVNGVQQGTTQTGFSTSIFSGSSPFLVGDRLPAGDPTTNFDGSFDEFGIWSRALTTTEITQLYNSGTPLPYPFTVAAATANFFPFMDRR